tara:strand:+ start:2070 stop:2213 length:144 start_codon:yes stop_codon:yes gene_type:complete
VVATDAGGVDVFDYDDAFAWEAEEEAMEAAVADVAGGEIDLGRVRWV